MAIHQRVKRAERVEIGFCGGDRWDSLGIGGEGVCRGGGGMYIVWRGEEEEEEEERRRVPRILEELLSD